MLGGQCSQCCEGGICCQPNGECIPEGLVTREGCEDCFPPSWLNACFEAASFICFDPETGLPISYPDCPEGYSREQGGNQPGRCGRLIVLENDAEPCTCMAGGPPGDGPKLLGFGVLSELPCYVPNSYFSNCSSDPISPGICGTWVQSCEVCSPSPCYPREIPNNNGLGPWPCREESPCPEGCECTESGRCVPICGAACDGETPCPEGCECVEGTCQNPLP